jgi:uncharacterized protein
MFGRKKRTIDDLNGLDRAAGTMVGLGALNWGLVGLANFDAVRAVFGKNSRMARAAYALVGASAAYALYRGRQLAKE